MANRGYDVVVDVDAEVSKQLSRSLIEPDLWPSLPCPVDRCNILIANMILVG